MIALCQLTDDIYIFLEFCRLCVFIFQGSSSPVFITWNGIFLFSCWLFEFLGFSLHFKTAKCRVVLAEAIIAVLSLLLTGFNTQHRVRRIHPNGSSSIGSSLWHEKQSFWAYM